MKLMTYPITVVQGEDFVLDFSLSTGHLVGNLPVTDGPRSLAGATPHGQFVRADRDQYGIVSPYPIAPSYGEGQYGRQILLLDPYLSIVGDPTEGHARLTIPAAITETMHLHLHDATLASYWIGFDWPDGSKSVDLPGTLTYSRKTGDTTTLRGGYLG